MNKKPITFSIEDFIDFYRTHSDSSTAKHFNISIKSLRMFCSDNNIERHSSDESRRLTKLEKYGSETYNNRNKYIDTYNSKSDEEKAQIVEKMFNTKNANCNGDLHSYLKDAALKGKTTRIEKYGDLKQSYILSAEKCKQTKLEKYGDENYCNPDKIKQTKLERYGNSFFVNPEKAKQTNIERYGASCTAQSEDVKKKVIKTNLEKYGSESYFSSEDFLNKRCEFENRRAEKTRQTNLSKYGVEYVFQNDEVKEKIKQTVSERYGVEYFCLSPNCRNLSSAQDSSFNLSFAKLLNNAGINNYEREVTIGKYSYDFKVENVLIEINPSPTHNSTWGAFNNLPKDSHYHQEKTFLANDNGYRCINVWDWDDIEKIINTLSKRNSVYARQCLIKEVSTSEAKSFIENYHLQGWVKSDINLGLFYNDELISIMTFGKPRYNKNYQYELLRYCSSMNVIGGSQKIFNHFIADYTPLNVISYCDLSKFDGSTYDKLGFELNISKEKITPSKHWYNIKTGRHVTDNLLRQRGFDQLFGKEYGFYGKGSNNEELMKEHGFVEIYDCGQATYVWSK